MAIPMIVTYRVCFLLLLVVLFVFFWGGGGGGAVSFLPHQQTEHLKIFGKFCSRATQVTRSDCIHVTDVVAKTNCCKLCLRLCMNMELLVLLLRRSDHF